MAIVIPSKNIYDKENPKVIDNIIHQIEFEEKQPNLVDEYGVVVFTKDADLTLSSKKEINPPISLDERQDTSGYYYKSIVGVKGNASYTTTHQNVFDQVQGNKYISKVYNFNEDKSPKVTLKYEKKTYHWLTTVDQYNNFDYTFKTEDNNELSSNAIGYEGIEYDIDLLSLGDISGALDQANTSNMKAHNRLGIDINGTTIRLVINPYISAEVKNAYFGETISSSQYNEIAEQDKDTLVFEDEGKYTLQWEYNESQSEFLANLDVTMCTAFVRRKNGDFSTPAYAIATRLVLKCVGISIDAYGDTITLNDTTRLTNRIGDTTSPYVFKYPSSDFLQSGNTYRGNDGSVQLATKKLLTQTLEQYKNGKETATVRCSISNYYNEYGGKMIGIDTPSRNKLTKSYDFDNTSTIGGVTATALADGGIRLKGTNTSGGRIFFNLTKKSFGGTDIICWEVNDYITSLTDDNSYLTLSKFGEGISNVALGYNKHNTTTWLSVDNGVTVDAIVYPMINEGQHIPYEAPNYSMAFSLYDEVIPMVYNAQGQDVPMSKYPDGTAKVFQVLGVKTYYDGAVWQELSLQELPQQT